MNAPDRVATTLPQRIDYHQVAKLLPYKAPWLLVDRVVSWDERTIVVQKAISGCEANMSAHLEEGPSIMPGVLTIEFVSQGLMLLMVLINMAGLRQDSFQGAGVMARTKATFHSPAFIGEVITATVTVVDVVGTKTIFEGVVKAGDRLVATVSSIGAQVFEPLTSAAA
ncbi:hotdog domain-containing protein [Ottowia sp.]|uniref:hotdog domain-containing protein n=1 Tax=Ottowia sp. TaxID=1898956 RepID=UPI0025D861D9|nr:hotdog domain-containing protein [Ottowia sp.]MBK6616483.1 hypothetical protein [Ottowia sp.]